MRGLILGQLFCLRRKLNFLWRFATFTNYFPVRYFQRVTCQVKYILFPKDSSIPFHSSFIYVNQTRIVGLNLHGQPFTLFTCYFLRVTCQV